MQSTMDGIEARARKLLAIIQDGAATENEVYTASAMLQSLLKEAGMTVADIEGSGTEAEVSEGVAADLSKLDPWRAMVAKAVARAYRCKVYTAHYRDGWTSAGKRRNRVRIMFMGYEADVERARGVYEASCAAAENCWKSERKRVARKYREMTYEDDPWADGWVSGQVNKARKDYLVGFATGLHRAFLENERADSELALAVVVPKAVEDRYAEEVGGKPRTLNLGRRTGEAYLRGAAAGQGVGSGDRICA